MQQPAGHWGGGQGSWQVVAAYTCAENLNGDGAAARLEADAGAGRGAVSEVWFCCEDPVPDHGQGGTRRVRQRGGNVCVPLPGTRVQARLCDADQSTTIIAFLPAGCGL